MTTWVEVCSNCKRHGLSQTKHTCTCAPAIFEPTPPAPATPDIPEMDSYTLLQLERDRTDRTHDLPGDWCKRWVTCTRCRWTSEPVGFWSDMDKVEDDHMLHGCPAPAPGYDHINDPIWPGRPLPWVFTYRIEPADEPTGRGINRRYTAVAGRRAPIVLHLPARNNDLEEAA